MKKIIMAIMAGILLMGCATTSGTSSKKNANFSRNDEGIEIIERIYDPIVTSEQFEKAEIYRFQIHTDDIEELLKKHSSKTERKNFSGKITNTTNRTAHIRIYPRGDKKIEGELPDVNISIPPHETYYFIIENFFTLGQNLLGISELDNPEWKGKMGYPFISIKDPSKECYPVAEEVLKTHSIEVIYNCESYATDKNQNAGIQYKFVEPFDDKIKNENNLVIIHQ